jgi:endonuclease/exonuclease/phosphatase family metal-dependent hydrolase
MSGSRPSVNIPLIGRLLNQYDLALVQEDFAYGPDLRRNLNLAYASPAFERGKRLDFGDGLSQFAKLPFSNYARQTWEKCHGILDSYFDCLTPKGFTWSRQQLSDGVLVDVYNLHMDAGMGVEDRRARAQQVEQLIRAIRRYSTDSALIVAGDTNLNYRETSLLDRLQRETGLRDACRALKCRDPGRIDRVFYRSSARLTLKPKSWRIDTRFVDDEQRPLSDHLAVAVELSWSERAELAATSASDADRVEVGNASGSGRL